MLNEVDRLTSEGRYGKMDRYTQVKVQSDDKNNVHQNLSIFKAKNNCASLSDSIALALEKGERSCARCSIVSNCQLAKKIKDTTGMKYGEMLFSCFVKKD